MPSNEFVGGVTKQIQKDKYRLKHIDIVYESISLYIYIVYTHLHMNYILGAGGWVLKKTSVGGDWMLSPKDRLLLACERQ